MVLAGEQVWHCGEREVTQVFTVCGPVVLAGEQVWHRGERVELDEVQGPGTAEQEVPLIQALQAEGHSQAG